MYIHAISIIYFVVNVFTHCAFIYNNFYGVLMTVTFE